MCVQFVQRELLMPKNYILESLLRINVVFNTANVLRSRNQVHSVTFINNK